MKRNAKTTVFAEFPKENSDTGPRKLNVFQFSGSHTQSRNSSRDKRSSWIYVELGDKFENTSSVNF